MNKVADEKQRELHKKFPNDSVFCNERTVSNFLEWVTFFRRNLHRFVRDYLGIKLYLYQSLMIYLMGISDKICTIASRASAKSFIVALYSVCRCILYPGSRVVIASSTRSQSKMIVSEKIAKELCTMSPVLKKEILAIKDSQNEISVSFKNGSSIFVVTASDSSRGVRSTVNIIDEFRLVSKEVNDAILSPFLIIRQAPYLKDEFYSNTEGLREEPVDIKISSSYFDSSWIWNVADITMDEMISGKPSCMLCFDEYIALRHKIKSQKFFQSEKRKQDPINFALEIENQRIKENTAAFFSYGLLQKNQRCRQPFYPQTTAEFLSGKKNVWQIPKLPGEIRLTCCDMAFVTNEKGKNDNSIFSCLRLLPEKKTIRNSESEEVEVSSGYHVSVHHMTAIQGGDTDMQSLEIRRLHQAWHGDYIVLDLRNAGIAIYDKLAKPLYDSERRIEYPPLCAMNSDDVANRIRSESAEPRIFVISASQKLNSDIAMIFRRYLSEEKIDLLIPFEQAKEEILNQMKEYFTADSADEQIRYELPFLETQALISETANLQYEKKQDTGVISIKEMSGWRKDRYTSVSYGVYVCDLLSRDLLIQDDDYQFLTLVD